MDDEDRSAPVRPKEEVAGTTPPEKPVGNRPNTWKGIAEAAVKGAVGAVVAFALKHLLDHH